MVGKMEYKERLSAMDLTVPAAPYDLRISLASEKTVDRQVRNEPPPGWTVKRIKRRRSYTRRDKSIAWQIDVTEVTASYPDPSKPADVNYEVEMELQAKHVHAKRGPCGPYTNRTAAKQPAWIEHMFL